MLTSILSIVAGKKIGRAKEAADRLMACEKDLAQCKIQLDIELFRVKRLEGELAQAKDKAATLRLGLEYAAFGKPDEDTQNRVRQWVRGWLRGKARESEEFDEWRAEEERRDYLA